MSHTVVQNPLMNNKIKLFRFFNGLSKYELKQLQEAVESPLYNLSQFSKKLYKLLVREYPNFDETEKGKEKIYAKLFPNQSYNDLKLRRVFSELTQLLRKFLAYNELQNDNWQREKVLAEIYADMGLTTLSQKVSQDLHKTMDKESVKNEEYWKKKMILYGVEQSVLLENNGEISVKMAEETIYAADRYFAYATVRQALLIKSKAKIFNTPINLPFLDVVKQKYQNGLLREDSLFRLYILALTLLETPREDVFYAFQSLYFSGGKDDLFLFYMGLNYAMRQMNAGNIDFQNIPLKWYKLGLESNALINNGLITRINFSNIVVLSCKNNEISWSHKFIDKYINQLPQDIQEEEFLYSKASIYFHEKRFHDTINILSEYSFSAAYILKAKIIISKAQYEIYLQDDTYIWVLKSSIRTFENYLYRDKSRVEASKMPYLNFCIILRKVLILSEKGTEKHRIKEWVEKQIETRGVVNSKQWILEKVNQLVSG